MCASSHTCQAAELILAQEEKRQWETQSRGRVEAHPSHHQTQSNALASVGGRFVAPRELADLSDHHAAQHAAAQQAHAAAQAAAAQQAAQVSYWETV